MPKKKTNKHTFRTILLVGGMLGFFAVLIVWSNLRSTTIDFILDEHPADREAKRTDREKNGYFLLKEAHELIPAKLVPYYAHDPNKPDDLKPYDAEPVSLGKLLDMARPDYHPDMLEFLSASQPAIENVRQALEKPYWTTPIPSLIESPYWETYEDFWDLGFFSSDWIVKILLGYGLVELYHFDDKERAKEFITMSWNVIVRTKEYDLQFFDPDRRLNEWYSYIFEYAIKGSETQMIFLGDLIAELKYTVGLGTLNSFYELIDNTIWFPDSPYYSKEMANLGTSIEQTVFRTKFSDDVEFLRSNREQIEGLFTLSYFEKRKWFADPQKDDFLQRNRSTIIYYRPFGRTIADITVMSHQVEMQRRAHLLALDIEFFKRRNGAYPKSLSELSLDADCDYLNDSFAEASIVYEIDDSGYSLYRKGIAGLDGRDMVFDFKF